MTVIGIDLGGSTTKIIGISKNQIFSPMQVRATDPLTSVFGALGRYMSENGISLKDVSEIRVTGVGSTYIQEDLYGIPTKHVDEFVSIGLGGLNMSGLSESIIVSMGTGTAFVYAKDGEIKHLGGTGVGGGTLLGLSSILLDMHNYDNIVDLAKEGSLANIDLTVGDMTNGSTSLPDFTTASNFGKISDYATKADKALGLINMIFQTIGMMAVFAARSYGLKDVVLCGNLTGMPFAKPLFDQIEALHGIHFHIPDMAEYIPAYGAALLNI